MTTVQQLNATIRDDLVALVRLNCQDPHRTLHHLKPNLEFGDILSVWEALVDNHVVLKDDPHWSLNPVQPDCPWRVDS